MGLQTKIKKIIKKIPEGIILDYAFYKGMESRNNYRYKASIEISLYCSVIQSDLVIASGRYRNTVNELEKKFYARILAMTLYEYLKDLSGILGKELVNELKKNKFEKIVNDIYELNKEFSNLRKSNQNVIRKIRNETTAHKTRNRISLVEQLFSIDDIDIYNLSIEIIILNNKLINILAKIKDEISKYHAENGELKIIK